MFWRLWGTCRDMKPIEKYILAHRCREEKAKAALRTVMFHEPPQATSRESSCIFSSILSTIFIGSWAMVVQYKYDRSTNSMYPLKFEASKNRFFWRTIEETGKLQGRAPPLGHCTCTSRGGGIGASRATATGGTWGADRVQRSKSITTPLVIKNGGGPPEM